MSEKDTSGDEAAPEQPQTVSLVQVRTADFKFVRTLVDRQPYGSPAHFIELTDENIVAWAMRTLIGSLDSTF